LLLSDTTLRFANHAKQRITQKACKSKHKSKAMYILLDKSKFLQEKNDQIITTYIHLKLRDDEKEFNTSNDNYHSCHDKVELLAKN
jgi:hypothetical protein